MWDEESRGRALRLAEYEDSICGCGCGQPVNVAYDKSRAFIVDKFTCYAGRALAQVQSAEADEAERTKRPDGWRDGLHYYVAPHEADTTTTTTKGGEHGDGTQSTGPAGG